MNYEGQICRPPMEKSSFMLPVAVGCSYNQCSFCTLFKHLSYRELPMEQIEAELKRVHDLSGSPQQIFLGDGNAFGLKTQKLLNILNLIHRYFPDCRKINMDATVTNIRIKTDEELEALAKAGVCRLYLGIESGLDDVLVRTKKDHDLAQAEKAIQRMQKAGLIYNAHIMTGIAGKGRGLENARATAEFFNRTKPERITNFSLFVMEKAPLYQEYEKGTFLPASEQESLKEERELLRLLEVPGLVYDGFHDFIRVRVRGTLPQDKEKMLKKLDRLIEEYEKKEPIYAVVRENNEN